MCRAVGWGRAGRMKGFARINGRHADRDGEPEEIFVRATRRDARRLLSNPRSPRRRHQHRMLRMAGTTTSDARSLDWKGGGMIRSPIRHRSNFSHFKFSKDAPVRRSDRRTRGVPATSGGGLHPLLQKQSPWYLLSRIPGRGQMPDGSGATGECCKMEVVAKGKAVRYGCSTSPLRRQRDDGAQMPQPNSLI